MNTISQNDRMSSDLRASAALLLGLTMLSSCDKQAEEIVENDEARCETDDSREASGAIDLAMDESVTGYICPRLDMDWYLFELESGNRLLSISSEMSSDLSAVELTYAVYPENDTQKAVAVPAGDGSAEVHCLDPGSYYLVVRDQGDDNEDIRHPYTLVLEGRPDPDGAEPNDDIESATALQNGSTTRGYIACQADQDWYMLEVARGNVLGIRLTSEPATYQPSLQLLSADKNLLAERVNPAGPIEATTLDIFHVLLATGKYYLVVSDDDQKEADPDVSYSLSVEAIEDKDTHEPNNSPTDATALADSDQTCAPDWSNSFEIQGTVGARADVDWFKLPVSGCAGGVIEAVVRFETQGLSVEQAWQFQSNVQASIALVRAHAATPCAQDLDCQSLNIACDPAKAGWECEGFFNSCRSDGFCTGGSVCLPTGVCGATETERHYRVAAIPDSIDGPPLENTVGLSAPLYGDSLVYLRVSDYQSDGGDAGVLYTLNVRIRQDPDANDRAAVPNNLYANLLNNDNFPVEESFSRAAALPVHDCAAGDCCETTASWVSGAISYQNDVDWFRYSHPCPCKDCLLRLLYQVDDGPVEHGLYLYRNDRLFFTFNIIGNGAFGDDECLYSYQGHCRNCEAVDNGAAECSTYYIAVRDYLGEGSPAQEIVGTASRWSSDQSYRICLEKYFEGCQSPCEVAQDGTCTSP
ncbi:MAG: hypothetical protein JXA30_22845 [Deltaproteobacteria bacterium]|nr:hypothetical protein [Deltaproteobacteria bacterium]